MGRGSIWFKDASKDNPAMPIWNDRYRYRISYQFKNLENKCQKLEEYLVYDLMATVGAVGGTWGLFIGILVKSLHFHSLQ